MNKYSVNKSCHWGSHTSSIIIMLCNIKETNLHEKTTEFQVSHSQQTTMTSSRTVLIDLCISNSQRRNSDQFIAGAKVSNVTSLLRDCKKGACVEDLNVITALKCNKLLSVTTFGLKCNNVIPTSSVTLLTCCWLLVVISCVIGHVIKKVSEHIFSGLSRDWQRHHTKLRFSLSDCFLSRAFCKLNQSMKFTSLLAAQ